MRDTIVCIASGSSLVPEDVEYCRDKARVLAVNDNFKWAPWADWLYACDGRWWARTDTSKFRGERWTMHAAAAEKYGLKLVEGRPGFGLSLDASAVSWGGDYPVGGNSGAQAINLAFHFGAKRVVLLGYDMAGKHWFGDHDGLANPTERNFAHWRLAFRRLAYDLGTQGVQLVNCTRSTTLDCAPIIPLREVL